MIAVPRKGVFVQHGLYHKGQIKGHWASTAGYRGGGPDLGGPFGQQTQAILALRTNGKSNDTAASAFIMADSTVCDGDYSHTLILTSS